MGLERLKPKGIFLNSTKANCSIYESGKMAYDCLALSDRFNLNYQEISSQVHSIEKHDFYLFNYHHATMSWLNTRSLSSLPGLKATLVLETLPNDPFVLCPSSDFDIYCALDPTMTIDDPRVYAFPRPLEIPTKAPAHKTHSLPVIGTFGFATPGKGFELVVDAVNREFDRAIVRINIPAGTYADKRTYGLQNQNYAQYLAQLCRKVAKKGIEVVVTGHYMTKEELIHWCAANTLNCFLYNRVQPGLSATTDQAISSGRPLAVSNNESFRHIHDYLCPYPMQSLSQAIVRSVPKVLEMQRAWSPLNFTRRFEEVLEDQGLLDKTHRQLFRQRSTNANKTPILIVTHEAQQCGIAQYGNDIAASLKKATRYDLDLAPCANPQALAAALARRNYQAVIYNYYPATMPWLDRTVTQRIELPQMGIMHEVTQTEADTATQDLFDFHLCPDPTLIEKNPSVIRTKRLIPPYINMKPLPGALTIGSFGFGFGNKGFENLIDLVQSEFDEAIIVLHMPFNDIVDRDGRNHALATAERCRLAVRKPGIKLAVNHKFLKKQQLLDLLASMTVNVFLYNPDRERGISSVIDSALAVQRPIALSRCGMFRHMAAANPSIFIDGTTLRQIIQNGITPLIPFYNEWSEAAFVDDYEHILDKVIGRTTGVIAASTHQGAGKAITNGPARKNAISVGPAISCFAQSSADTKSPMASDDATTVSGIFNRILDHAARALYAPVIARMHRLVPEIMARKIPAANVQQAFVLDTVEKFAAYHMSPKILCVGCFEDTAAASLKRLGYKLEEIDPTLNYDLNAFFHLPTTIKGSYDIVFSTSVLEHVPNDAQFASQLSDLLAPGGVAILTVDFNDQYRPGDALPQEDFRFYTQKDLKDRLPSLFTDCSMVDLPNWYCPEPDFVYAGCRYTFASFVVQKRKHPIRREGASNTKLLCQANDADAETIPTIALKADSIATGAAKSLLLVNVSQGFETGIMPLGLASISAYLKKYGGFLQIRMLDAHTHDIYANLENADVIGIGATTQTINQAIRFARYVKSKHNTPIILGGVHLSTHRKLPAPFDIGVIGEGEETMLELMRLPDFSTEKLQHIKGICFHQDGGLVFTPERELIMPLDRIPMPDREITDLRHYLKERQIIPYYSGRSLTLITSRGCPFHCIFCSTSLHWKKFRAFSAKRVVEEMTCLIDRYHAEIIHIFDDLFIADKKRLKEIHRLVVQNGIQRRAKFMCLVRSDMLDDDTMRMLKEMNVVVTGIGMESGCPETLKRLKKNTTTVEDNRRAIALSQKYEIPTMGTFMVGNPGESEQDLLQTLSFIRGYRHTPFFTPLTYISAAFPGTEFWNYGKQKGIRVEDYDHILMDIPDRIEAITKAPLLTDIPLDRFFEIIQLFATETRYGAEKKKILAANGFFAERMNMESFSEIKRSA